MLLEVKDLTVYYGTVQALNNICLTVGEGEIVAMIGPNGAGKSTALKAICGLLKASDGKIAQGEVLFSGESIKNIPPHDLVRKGISLVPEGRRLFPTMTVMENLEMGGYINNNKKMTEASLNRVLDLFPVLNSRRKQKAGTLSSGEQQILAIGRGLMLQPKLLLLDEPSLGLSPNYVETIFEKLKEVNKESTTVLLVEQNARMALEYADRAYVFRIGEIFLEDSAENLLRNDEIKKSFLGE